METLIISHHRNHHQYHGPTNFDSFGSASSGKFPGISCRTFQSGVGLLPTPLKFISSPVKKDAVSASFSPQTSSPSSIEIRKDRKRNAKISTAPIPIKINFEGEFHFSERWAGPAYSNSPPPSSLPLPKFSMRPKRTISFDFPSLASEIDMHPIAKSAPASPTRWLSSSPDDLFDSADSATKTLRRILNLDISND